MSRWVRSFGRWALGGLATGALLAGIGAAQPAAALSAGAVSLFNGSTLSVNGLTFTVSNCGYQFASLTVVNCPNGGAGSFEMLQTAGAGSSIKIQGIDGGSIFSNISFSSSPSVVYDLHFTLQITAASSRTSVNNVSMTMNSSKTGSGSTPGAAVGGSESSNVTGFTNIVLGGFGTTSGSSTMTRTFPNTQAFNVTKDLNITPFLISGVDTVSLNYVTQTFTPAPEPVSSAVILSGLAGLAFVRRRRAKATR